MSRVIISVTFLVVPSVVALLLLFPSDIGSIDTVLLLDFLIRDI